jgi:hypothetical protein
MFAILQQVAKTQHHKFASENINRATYPQYGHVIPFFWISYDIHHNTDSLIGTDTKQIIRKI